MKLLVLGPWSSGHIQAWVSEFKGSHDITVVTLHPNEYLDKDINFIVLPAITKTRLDFFLNIPKLFRIARKINPDVLHVHFLSSYGIMGAFLNKKIKKILSVWGTDVNGKIQKNKLLRYIVGVSLSRYDIVNLPAIHMLEKINKIATIDQGKVHTFQYGVNTNKLPLKKTNTYPHKNEVKIASIRNWSELYHIDDLLFGYDYYCQKYNNIDATLYVYGCGSEEDTRRIKTLISNLSYTKGRIELVGFVSKSELYAALSNMDIVISIPDKDGAPLSLMESLYIGLYPVVSKIDANFEWLDSKYSEYIADYSKESIGHAIQKAAELIVSGKATDAIEFNRSLIEERGDYIINMKRTESIYQELLNSQK